MFIHLAVYEGSIGGIFSGGISGFAVDETPVDGKSSGFFGLQLSELILFMEWGLILLGVIFVYAKHKIDLKKEFHDLETMKASKHFSKGTEIDNFYDLLKEMKHFRLSTAAKVFDVDEEVVEDWAKSLESGRMAALNYPRIGGPEIMMKEDKKEVDGSVEKEKKVVKKGESVVNKKPVEKKKEVGEKDVKKLKEGAKKLK